MYRRHSVAPVRGIPYAAEVHSVHALHLGDRTEAPAYFVLCMTRTPTKMPAVSQTRSRRLKPFPCPRSASSLVRLAPKPATTEVAEAARRSIPASRDPAKTNPTRPYEMRKCRALSAANHWSCGPACRTRVGGSPTKRALREKTGSGSQEEIGRRAQNRVTAVRIGGFSRGGPAITEPRARARRIRASLWPGAHAARRGGRHRPRLWPSRWRDPRRG